MDLHTRIAPRLKLGLGLSISFCGRLEEPESGRPAGMPYVVIQAETAMDRDIARQILAEEVSVSDLTWDFGWTPRRRPDGRRVTELKLFPASK